MTSEDDDATDLECPKLRMLDVLPWQDEERPYVVLRDPEGISDKAAVLPAEIVPFLFGVLDGRHRLTDIQTEYARLSGGEILLSDDLRALLSRLDEALLLDSPRYRRRLSSIERAYRASAARPAVLAGECYPSGKEDLLAFLGGFYEGVKDGDPRPVRAVAAPHLDLRSGGTTAAKGLKDLRSRFDGDRVVVLGVGHHMAEAPFALTGKDFETPLGTVPLDRELYDRVVSEVGSWVLDEELRHRNEHSVEFAAILLKHALPDRDLKILPVLCGSFHRQLFGGGYPEEDPRVDAFLETIREAAEGALLYASVDLSHMGPHYGDRAPLRSADLRRIESEDLSMLEAAANGDATGFFEQLRRIRDGQRVCGMSALYSLLRLLPEGLRGRLAAYEQPVFPEEGNTVTICSMVW